jgi:hypothetical protein
VAWTTRDIPDQNGRVAVVTGGNDAPGPKGGLEVKRSDASVVIRGARRSEGGGGGRDPVILADVADPQLELGTGSIVGATDDRSYTWRAGPRPS